MIASDYRHSVTISQQIATSQGIRGQDVYTTKTFGPMFAKIEPLTGRKLEIARQVVPLSSHELTIRFITGITANCKVHFGSRTFEIGNVSDRLETGFQLTLLCIEVI